MQSKFDYEKVLAFQTELEDKAGTIYRHINRLSDEVLPMLAGSYEGEAYQALANSFKKLNEDVGGALMAIKNNLASQIEEESAAYKKVEENLESAKVNSSTEIN